MVALIIRTIRKLSDEQIWETLLECCISYGLFTYLLLSGLGAGLRNSAGLEGGAPRHGSE